MARRVNFKEIYFTYSDIESELIRGLLEDHDIYCIVRDMRITPYPVSIGEQSEKRIAVEEDRVEEAKELIRWAIKDGYISREGRFKE